MLWSVVGRGEVAGSNGPRLAADAGRGLLLRIGAEERGSFLCGATPASRRDVVEERLLATVCVSEISKASGRAVGVFLLYVQVKCLWRRSWISRIPRGVRENKSENLIFSAFEESYTKNSV